MRLPARVSFALFIIWKSNTKHGAMDERDYRDRTKCTNSC